MGEQRPQQQENEEIQAMVRRSRSSSVSTTASTRSNISGRSKDSNPKETFVDFFGSKSSGLGSERRSSSICGENLEDEEKSSKNCIPSEPELVSPLLSPDSCLEDEISLLEEPNLCIECATRATVEAAEEIEVENESLEVTEINITEKEDSTDKIAEKETEEVISVVE